MFVTLADRLTATFVALQGKGRLSEADIDATCRQIRIALLEADVALPVVKQFISSVRDRARSAEVSAALNPAEQVVKIVHAELTAVLGGQNRPLTLDASSPTVIMLVGLQGAGKTTLAGKLAYWLKDQGHRPLLVAADLIRPNAVNQLQVNAQRAGVPIYAPEPGNGAGDPVAVARDGVDDARARGCDVVLVDTAGRLGIDAEMMGEAARIRDAVNADEVLLVLDAMTGQDAARTAQTFTEILDLTGLVVTKLDGDSRGGAALSLTAVTGQPVMFASTGENLTDLEPFHPDRMASRILDLGDMLTLIEKAERAFDVSHAEATAGKLVNGRFGLGDFVEQMQTIRKMGPLTKVVGLLPGMGEVRAQLEELDERELDRIAAIVYSMTPAERATPELLDASRLTRVARGSGRHPEDVTALVERFFEARQMMTDLVGVRDRPAGRAGKGRRKSGNPAKRADRVSGTHHSR